MSRWDHYGRSLTGDSETADEPVEPDGGSTEADSGSSDSPFGGGSSEEAKLRLYDSLREEILCNVDNQVTQNSRGVGTVVLIVGYAINFDQLAVLAVVPVILSYLLIWTAESRAWMANAAGQITKIEREITEKPTEDSFGFEHQLGGSVGEDIRGVRRFRDVPAVIRIFFVAGVYVITILGVLFVVWPLEEPPRLLNVKVTQSVLTLLYGALAVSVLASGISVAIFMMSLESYLLSDEGKSE